MSELSIAESIRQDYEEEINKQAKVIQWYEKENKYNQEIIIKDIKEIERLNSIIKEVREYIKDIQNTMWHDDKEVLKTILEILDKEKQ